MKFATKIFLLYLGFTIVIVVPTYLFLYRTSVVVIEAEIESHLEERAVHIMDKIDRGLFERLADIRMLADSFSFLLEEPDISKEKLTRYLLHYYNNYKIYLSLAFYDAKRVKVVDTHGGSLGTVAQDSLWVREVFERERVSAGDDIHFAENLQKEVIIFAVPVYGKHLQILGAIVGSLSTENIYSILGDVEQLSEGRFRTHIDLFNKQNKRLYSNHDNRQLSEKIGQTKSDQELSRLFGEKYIYSTIYEKGYLNFEGNQWRLVVHFPKQEAFAVVDNLRNRILLISLSLLLTAMMGISFHINKIVRPLHLLEQAAIKLTQGHFNVTIPIVTNDEIGRLAFAFNQMTTALKDNIEALRKSEERFNLALQGSNDGLWDWDIPKEIVHYSPRFKQILGLSPEQPLGLVEYLERIHPEDLPELSERVYDYLEQRGPTYEICSRVRHEQGYYIWVLSRGIAVWSADNKPLRMVGTITTTRRVFTVNY